MASPMHPLIERAQAPRDIAGLVAFRVLFGLLGLVSSVRFVANGWVERFFGEPTFFFKYWGFGWVEVLPTPWMTAAFVVMAVCSACIAVGFCYRAATVGYFVTFTYVELIDVTNYLNHYYLVSLLALLMCALPLHAAGSVDARLRPALRRATLPAWMTWLLRVQVGVVYVNAALAKATTEWLVHAQPLNIWLNSLVDLPVIGPWLDLWSVALALSWAGFLYDLCIVPLLLWSRARALAWVAVLTFHAMTRVFFDIGMFPVIMIVATTVFFAPDWPRRWLPGRSARAAGSSPQAPATARRAARVWMIAALVFATVQVLLPLRMVVYGGNGLWHEQGMRWSWRVMVREKNGSVTYRVRLPERERELLVSPGRYLTDRQEREMSGQPDLILQLGHHIGQHYLDEGHASVEVRVDALVSLNGRRAVALIDPDVDLMRIEDGLAPATWIRPAPQEPPIRLDRQPQTADTAARARP